MTLGTGGRSPSIDCSSDPAASLKEMFVDLVMGRRLNAGQTPALRPVFLKPHGVAVGRFDVRRDLPEELRVGLFAHDSFPAVVRLSSDTTPRTPDLGTTVGMAIKLIGVPGRKLLHEEAPTCDLLLQNHDVFFVDTAQDMCEFIRAGVVEGDYRRYLDKHPETRRILEDMRKAVPSALRATYWGLLPHTFGPDRHAKYKLAPVGSQELELSLDASVGNYLYVDLKTRLLRASAAFVLFVQLRTDAEAMPLDHATVRWDEQASPPIPVADLTLPAQNIDTSGRGRLGEDLSFNLWQTLPEHSPVGSLAGARRTAYAAAADVRRERNDVPRAEPAEAPAVPEAPSPPDAGIVRAEIYPAIGIARVGNSAEEFFLGPELVDPPPQPPGFYRDGQGALKRQAARFRIYGYDAGGQVVRELTVDDAVIEWTVHVANKKAAWYDFTLAMDIDAVHDPRVVPARRRNAQVRGDERKRLVIDPGPRSIHGRDTAGSTWRFDTGRFLDEPVYLGELRTDESGRLIFLGGRGRSGTPFGGAPYDFANNDGWWDDISDGPVTAQVWLDGREIPVEPAWVAVAPPNYAPELKSVRTMYDLLADTFRVGASEPVSFTRHILPILRRLCDLQWVNAGFAEEFGWGAPHELVRPDLLDRLRDPGASSLELRRQVFQRFRDYSSNNGWRGLWPWLYGDSMDLDGSSRLDLALTNTQLARLGSWASGDFEPGPDPGGAAALEGLPLDRQPLELTEAALSFCLADAFHPGCELTWIMRVGNLYEFRSRFRIRHRPASVPEPDYGDTLDPRVATSSNGPLAAQGPGDLTRWMAVPWQTDTASCRSGYERYTPATPTFWPARVPNQVLTREDYDIVLDPCRAPEERAAAFRRRQPWMRLLKGSFYDQIFQMVSDFGLLGVVERLPGPEDGAYPEHLLVESTPPGSEATAFRAAAEAEERSAADGFLENEYIPKIHRFRTPRA